MHFGLFGLSKMRMFGVTEAYLSGQGELWRILMTLPVDFFLEIFWIVCGYFSVWVVMLLLASLGLRRFLERIFGPVFRKEMF